MSGQFIERINFTGNMDALLNSIADEYALGRVESYAPIEIGYEDYNLKVATSQGAYLVKIFASDRSEDECKRYVSLIETVIGQEIAHPRLVHSSTANYMYRPVATNLRLIVMEWIDGETYYEISHTPTEVEIDSIVKEAARISNVEIKLPFHYDEWSLDNIGIEFEIVKPCLDTKLASRIALLIDRLASVQKSKLPQGLVHGDLIKTNVMKAKDGKVYLLDFSVANDTYRINELAVLCCNLFFDENSVENSRHLYKTAVSSYDKHQKLTPYEKEVLPYLVEAAHAMHVIGATKYELEHGPSEENDYWKSLGKTGLSMDIYHAV